MRLNRLFSIVLTLMLIFPFLCVNERVNAVSPYENFSTYQSIEPFDYNHTKFWSLFNAHSEWNLEYDNGSGWISIKSDLEIIKNRSGALCKIALNFTASFNADYRLTFGIDLDVKSYVHKANSWNYTLTYQNYTAVFDFNDLKGISGLILSHGVKPIDSELWFWFRIRKNNVPLGKNVFLDPTLEDFTTYQVIGGNTQFISNYEVRANPYDRDVNESVYKDFGADYFGIFEHDFALYWDSLSHSTASNLGFWGVSNDVNDYRSWSGGLLVNGEESASRWYCRLQEVSGGVFSNFDTIQLFLNRWYFFTIKRDGLTSLTLEIYSTYLLREIGGAGNEGTLTLTIPNTLFQYVYALVSFNSGNAGLDAYGNIRNLNLDAKGYFISFAFNDGGLFRVDNVTIANNTETEYGNGSILELLAIVEGNLTFGFNNFTWNIGFSILNPYNFTVSANASIWCYFEPFISVEVAVGGFSVGIGAGLILGLGLCLIIGIAVGKKLS